MTHHHPGDDLLLAFSAGRIEAGPAVVLGVHLDGCPTCRARVRMLQALGGAMLDEVAPARLATDAWTRTLERIDSPPPPPAPAPSAAPPLPWPDGVPWPASLRRCEVSRWHWMGPGMRYARVGVPGAPQDALFLLRIGAGRSLARHTHHGSEYTQVLCGSFDDGRSVFGPGDFDETDPSVHHQPVVRAGSECICLAHADAPLRFDGRVAAWIGGWVGL
jgi:putative transcriptional regulator